MTRPMPVTAYAAVNKSNGEMPLESINKHKSAIYLTTDKYRIEAITILPTEQHEAMERELNWYKEQMCEGFCADFPTSMANTITPEMRNDCAGCPARCVLAALKEQPKEAPTPTVSDEWEILKRLAAGDRIHFSQDGEMAWFIGGDKAFVCGLSGLRNKGYLSRKGDDEENYRGGGEYDTISEKGLAALKEQDHG